MPDTKNFPGLPHVRVEDFSDRDFLRIQEDVQRAEAHEHNVETGALKEDYRGYDEKEAQGDVEDHSDVSLGVEQATAESAAAADRERVEDGPAKDSPKDEDGKPDVKSKDDEVVASEPKGKSK